MKLKIFTAVLLVQLALASLVLSEDIGEIETSDNDASDSESEDNETQLESQVSTEIPSGVSDEDADDDQEEEDHRIFKVGNVSAKYQDKAMAAKASQKTRGMAKEQTYWPVFEKRIANRSAQFRRLRIARREKKRGQADHRGARRWKRRMSRWTTDNKSKLDEIGDADFDATNPGDRSDSLDRLEASLEEPTSRTGKSGEDEKIDMPHASDGEHYPVSLGTPLSECETACRMKVNTKYGTDSVKVKEMWLSACIRMCSASAGKLEEHSDYLQKTCEGRCFYPLIAKISLPKPKTATVGDWMEDEEGISRDDYDNVSDLEEEDEDEENDIRSHKVERKPEPKPEPKSTSRKGKKPLPHRGIMPHSPSKDSKWANPDWKNPANVKLARCLRNCPFNSRRTPKVSLKVKAKTSSKANTAVKVTDLNLEMDFGGRSRRRRRRSSKGKGKKSKKSKKKQVATRRPKAVRRRLRRGMNCYQKCRITRVAKSPYNGMLASVKDTEGDDDSSNHSNSYSDFEADSISDSDSEFDEDGIADADVDLGRRQKRRRQGGFAARRALRKKKRAERRALKKEKHAVGQKSGGRRRRWGRRRRAMVGKAKPSPKMFTEAQLGRCLVRCGPPPPVPEA